LIVSKLIANMNCCVPKWIYIIDLKTQLRSAAAA